MAKNRRGGERTPKKPAFVKAPGPGAKAGQNRTDGGPADKQAIRRLPNADYGANKAFVSGQQNVGGLPMATPSPQQIVKSAQKPKVFGPTELPNQVPTAGSATGAGPGIDRIALAADDMDIFLDVLNERDPENLLIKQLINTRNKEINR